MSEEQSRQDPNDKPSVDDAELLVDTEGADQEGEPVATSVEGEVLEVNFEPSASVLQDLGERLVAAEQRADEYRDQALRTQAEMENLRRRTEREIQEARKFALERFAKELLVVLDSLELGIQAAVGDTPEVVKHREGGELTLKQFLAVLEKFNVTAIDALGQKFNPELHQAMTVDNTTDAEPNTVVRVFQKGYVINERLLRPAMVVIAQKA